MFYRNRRKLQTISSASEALRPENSGIVLVE